MVQVKVTEGILEGEKVINDYGGEFYSFKGIPFAEPPIGDLRFKAPQPPKPWNGVRSAKEFGPDCYQMDMFFKATGGSEDCLYLNIYTPEIKPANPLPVMVWIHGGGFMSGNGRDDLYGPEFLVQHGVILVTINYRLEALGFLCLDTEEIPGNAGMKDQVAALRWINKNIKNFGGDPDNVTIFGESAGGASVSFLLVSPMTKGLFKRAIAQSGVSCCAWAQPFEPRQRALALAKQFGCTAKDDQEIADFFKSLPYEKLITLKVPITIADESRKSIYLYFGIVSEKEFGNNERFFYGDIIETLNKGIHEGVQVITGVTTDEGLVAFSMHNDNLDLLLSDVDRFPEYFLPHCMALNLSMSAQLEAGKKVKEHYFGNETVSKENVEQLVKFYSADMFVYPALLWSKICSKNNQVFFYKFTCVSERNVMGTVLGVGDLIKGRPTVAHADELPYLFSPKVMDQKVDQNSRTYKMIQRITALWTNFAKYGNPTPDKNLGVSWPQFSAEKQEYLEIGEELTSAFCPEKEEFEFWESLFKEYYPKMVE